MKNEKSGRLHIVFVDLTKPFDMVSIEGMYNCTSFWENRLSVHSRSLDRLLHDDMKARMPLGGALSSAFVLKSGVKHGCVLIPTALGIFSSSNLLFWRYPQCMSWRWHRWWSFLRIYIDTKLFNLVRQCTATNIRQILVRDLLFANATAFVLHSETGLQSLMPFVKALLGVSNKNNWAMHHLTHTDKPQLMSSWTRRGSKSRQLSLPGYETMLFCICCSSLLRCIKKGVYASLAKITFNVVNWSQLF